ncbi:hypothetical protein F5Y14DRAFT_55343 [Nemania sp. NC0429]|nr:hypothetical protein F5Y14DRAFT_55343 [Nemania sp. NC0429]
MGGRIETGAFVKYAWRHGLRKPPLPVLSRYCRMGRLHRNRLTGPEGWQNRTRSTLKIRLSARNQRSCSHMGPSGGSSLKGYCAIPMEGHIIVGRLWIRRRRGHKPGPAFLLPSLRCCRPISSLKTSSFFSLPHFLLLLLSPSYLFLSLCPYPHTHTHAYSPPLARFFILSFLFFYCGTPLLLF